MRFRMDTLHKSDIVVLHAHQSPQTNDFPIFSLKLFFTFSLIHFLFILVVSFQVRIEVTHTHTHNSPNNSNLLKHETQMRVQRDLFVSKLPFEIEFYEFFHSLD